MMKQRMSRVVVCEVWLRLVCGVVGDIVVVLGSVENDAGAALVSNLVGQV